jgi:hypothetical protein
MGWLSVVIGIVAAILFWMSHDVVLVGVAAFVTLGAFWSYGVMHNHATDAARNRPGFTGGFYDLRERELAAVPNWLAAVNMLFAVAAVILLGMAIYFQF